MRRRVGWALVWMAAGMGTLFAQTPAMPDFRFSSLEESKQVHENMRQAVWALPAAMGDTGVDLQGRNFAQDLAEVVFRDEASKSIEAAMAAAGQTLAANPDADPVATLAPVSRLLGIEGARIMLISTFWNAWSGRNAHRAYIDPLLAMAPAPQQASVRDELSALDVRLGSLRTVASAADPLAVSPAASILALAEVMKSFNSIRVKLAEAQSLDLAQRNPDRPYRERTSACPPPIAPRSANAGLALHNSVDIGRFYPQAMQRLGVEGLVRVEIRVSEGGCVTGVRALQSSGAAEIDDAALQVALEFEMKPASRAGVAIASEGVLPVRFALYDEPPVQRQPD